MLKKVKNNPIFGIFFLFLAVINGIFVLKYGLRFKPLLFTVCVGLFILSAQLTGLLLCFKIPKNKIKRGNQFYWVIVLLFFILTLVINNSVDGTTLKTDRWSAMHVGIEAALNGDYPYTAIDHLGGRTSNLPALLLLGIPFYLLGDVGYLQSFTFLIFALLIFRLFKNMSVRFGILLLLISSPCYLYEIYVKSDLISNFILVLLFVIFSFKKLNDKIPKYPILWGILGSMLFYTRLTAIIPLILTFFQNFFRWPVRHKALFITSGLVSVILLSAAAFLRAPSMEIFMDKNPFILQNRQLPFILSVLFIVLPCFFSFRVQHIRSLLNYCVLLLTLPVVAALVKYMIQFGIWPAIRDSRFDLSYLNIITPFLIIYLGFILDDKWNTKNKLNRKFKFY